MLCEECARPYPETHHCVFRSQSPLMIDMEVNQKHLCHICHRGKEGPHLNRKKDLQYKLEVQKKLSEILYKEYYTLEGLQKALKISQSKAVKAVKTLEIHKEGYKSIDVIRVLMGGRLYVESEVA